MIAMALACQPRLLADEPTTALDVSLRGQILALLGELQRETGMAVLLITHDLNLVRRFADRVAVMEHGRLVEQGATAAPLPRRAMPTRSCWPAGPSATSTNAPPRRAPRRCWPRRAARGLSRRRCRASAAGSSKANSSRCRAPTAACRPAARWA
jgi:ABC-type dipeptide/oligopeptide/nickel transport system ATPase component